MDKPVITTAVAAATTSHVRWLGWRGRTMERKVEIVDQKSLTRIRRGRKTEKCLINFQRNALLLYENLAKNGKNRTELKLEEKMVKRHRRCWTKRISGRMTENKNGNRGTEPSEDRAGCAVPYEHDQSAASEEKRKSRQKLNVLTISLCTVTMRYVNWNRAIVMMNW